MLRLENNYFEAMKEFKYLGVLFTEDVNNNQHAVYDRLQAANVDASIYIKISSLRIYYQENKINFA